MPNRIRILPDEIANRIAAGEVVERPASAVKELVENAIDAGADRVVVDLAAGGKEGIRVSDNGSGMSRDDTLLALERHATSKIFDLSDLRSLRTLGFRGEALPSIAAVSRMTVETRTEDNAEGTRVVVEGGRVRDVTPVGRDRGTTVTAHGLFFNVPARRKFLKTVETELRHCVNAVTGLALAYPEIAFVLSHSGREVLNLDRAQRGQRMEAIFGIRLGGDAIPVEGEGDGARIWGFVGRPEAARKSGTQQAAVVNGRWVQHRAITSEVGEGFGGLLSKGLYTSFALFVDLDPERLDVNVHPSKREVRFADERTIYRLVAETVRRALRQADGIPEMPHPADGPTLPPLRTRDGFGTPARAPASLIADGPPVEWGGAESIGLEGEKQMALPLTVARRRQEAGEGLDDEGGEGAGVTLSVWQLHHRYVLAHTKNGLIVVDQHRAHERILYEEVLSRLDATPGTGQRLLFPLTLDFGLSEIQTVREAMPLLERIGFGIRDFGGHTVVVDAIPVGLKVWEEGQLLRSVVQDLVDREAAGSSGSDERSPFERRLAGVYAHYPAIQAGDGLSAPEMQGLIDRLFATREPFVCPQGRPTVIRMSLDELDRRFT